MKIDVERKMVMEKLGKGRESENRRRGRLVQCSKRCMREEAGQDAPVLPSLEEVLLEAFMLVQLQRRCRQTNQQENEREVLLLGNNETSL